MIINSLTISTPFLHQCIKNSVLVLFGFLLLSCTPLMGSSESNEIQVVVQYNEQTVSCGQTLSMDSVDWSLQQLAFFMSELKVRQNGEDKALELDTNEWQNEGVAMLQWTDCAAQQAQSGAQDSVLIPPYHASLQLAQAEDFSAVSHLKFTLGLPFELNHRNPLSQSPPLNIPSMFWSWRGGYKFFRLDMQGQSQRWVFHLGSTGCVADSAMRSPKLQCKAANRVEFNLPKQQFGEVLVLHIDRLLAGVLLNNKTACLMQPQQASCQQLMTNLLHNEVFEWR